MKVKKNIITVLVIIPGIILFLLLFSTVYILGWIKKSVNDITISMQNQIIQAYDINLNGNEVIEKFERREYFGNAYYAIKITGVENIKKWCEDNPTYYVKTFKKGGTLFNNSKYAHIKTILIDEYNPNPPIKILPT